MIFPFIIFLIIIFFLILIINRKYYFSEDFVGSYDQNTIEDIIPILYEPSNPYLKEELTEVRFVQEVMAEFGEEARGVYLKTHLDKAVELGQLLNIEYQHTNFPRRGPRILGVDWDKMEADTNMVGVEYIEEFGVFAPFIRIEIPRNEFTYDNAVRKIIELNDVYDFDYIAVDAGHGEMHIEYEIILFLRCD